MTTSHLPAFSVLRMRPRPGAHRVWEPCWPKCSATMAASLFSNPASALFENGRLLGSAQTRSSRSDAAAAVVASPTRKPRAMPGQLFRRRMAGILTICAAELEDQQFAPAGGVERQILRRAGEPQRTVAHPRIDLGIGHHTRPAADARQDRDVLLPVGAAIGDRLADEPGSGAKLPKYVPILGVDYFEKAIHGAVEGDITCCDQSAAPDRQLLVDLPDLLARDRVPRHELAAIAARAGIHVDVCADIGRPGDVADLRSLEVHAEMLMGHVEKFCTR